ncbi:MULTISPECIES: hypothetical protein [Pseudomonas]|uniref:hypothetical protein n=1 Tax=Pseudomonas TaxID=286 RepID=UPI000CFC206D|nr:MULTISPECIES: hypothetical protein [Pseudomonas]PQZ92738.1 hypothetical protein CQ048_09485 [Pseudomonas trivialis]PRB26622.1 hypothetical protein CQ041_12785 [Pseudomonas sp. MYb60]
MHMLITPMRCKGVALTAQERRRYNAIRGDVLVSASACNELGRSSNVACMRVGMPLEPESLPRLLDATLSGMASTGFVLSGIEYIEGCAYAQSWWCRLG